MLNNKKIVVVLPAYNAAKTLEKTFNEIPFDIVDEVVLVDDSSKDDTIEIGYRIGIKHIIKHDKNLGYGEVVKVIDLIKTTGINKIAISTTSALED